MRLIVENAKLYCECNNKLNIDIENHKSGEKYIIKCPVCDRLIRFIISTWTQELEH